MIASQIKEEKEKEPDYEGFIKPEKEDSSTLSAPTRCKGRH